MGLFGGFKKKKEAPAPPKEIDTPPSLEEPSIMKGGGLAEDIQSFRMEETPHMPKEREGSAPALPRELKPDRETPEFPLPPNLEGTTMDAPKGESYEETIAKNDVPTPHEDHHFIDHPTMKPAPMAPPEAPTEMPEHEKPIFDPLPAEPMHEEEPIQEPVEPEPEVIEEPAAPLPPLPEEEPKVEEPVVVEEEHHHIPGKAQCFITMHDFNDLVNVSHALSEETNLSDDTLYRMNDLANTEDKLFEKWQLALEKFNEHVEGIDNIIFKR